MAFQPKRFSPLRRPNAETLDQVGQRLDRVQDAFKAVVDPLSTYVGGLGTGASADIGGLSDTPALALASSASAGTSEEASRSDHRHPLPAPLLVANGGTGLTSLGTKYQILQVNEGATALEYVAPQTQAPIITLPNASASLGSTYASHVGVPAFGAITTARLNTGGSVDRILAQPWVAPYTKSVSTLIWELTTGDAGKVVNWALYDSDSDGYPVNRVAAVSSISVTTPAMKSSAFSASYTVQRGRLYWVAWTCDSATTAQARCWPMPSYSGLGFFTGVADLAFAASSNYFRVTATYAVPPATMPTGGTLPGLATPIIGIY